MPNIATGTVVSRTVLITCSHGNSCLATNETVDYIFKLFLKIVTPVKIDDGVPKRESFEPEIFFSKYEVKSFPAIALRKKLWLLVEIVYIVDRFHRSHTSLSTVISPIATVISLKEGLSLGHSAQQRCMSWWISSGTLIGSGIRSPTLNPLSTSSSVLRL